jgi:hypothetical protein
VDWIDVAQRRALVNTVLNLLVAYSFAEVTNMCAIRRLVKVSAPLSFVLQRH